MQMVTRHFERLFPGRVSHVRMAVDTRDVNSLIREYWKLRQKAIDLLDEYESTRKRGKPVKRRRVCSSASAQGIVLTVQELLQDV